MNLICQEYEQKSLTKKGSHCEFESNCECESKVDILQKECCFAKRSDVLQKMSDVCLMILQRGEEGMETHYIVEKFGYSLCSS